MKFKKWNRTIGRLVDEKKNIGGDQSMKKNYVILALFCLGVAGGFGYGAGQASKDEIVPEPTRVQQKASSENKQQKETPQKGQNIEKTNQTACGQNLSEAPAYTACLLYTSRCV